MMAIAVLLPVYRGDTAEHFEQALMSILSQSDCPDEIRVYLGIDGPLDSSLERIIEAHQGNLYRIVRSRENVGPTEILNRLIQKLGGERLIFRMDADDISLPGRLRKQIEFMDQNPEIHILGTAIEVFDTDSGESTLRTYPTDPEVMCKYICFASPLAHPTVCMRPEVLKIVDGYPNIRGQDLALWIEALSHGFKISNLDEPLLRLRVSPSFFKRRRSAVRALPEFRLFVKGVWKLHGISWRYIFPFARFIFRLTPIAFAGYIYKSKLRNRHTAHGRRLV